MRFAPDCRSSFICLVSLAVSIGCQPATVPVSFAEAESSEVQSTKQNVSTSVETLSEDRGNGWIAVINLNEIARQLGERERWQSDMADREAELNERLEVMKMSFEKELEETKASLGEDLTEEQNKSIKAMTARYNASILQEREHARGEYAQFQVGLESEFRTKVKSVALDVARSLGYSVVLQHNTVFDYDASTEITVRVIEKLQGANEFADSPRQRRENVSQRLPGGGQFRPVQE